ncbi:MAG: alpha/beta hydrolase family protein [Novosphingobium sp.]
MMGSVQAQAPTGSGQVLAAKFGALESVGQISMAPDASKLAYLSSVGDDQVLFIQDMVTWGKPRPLTKISASTGHVSWCRWASNDRLVCEMHTIFNDAGTLLGFTRLFAIGADGQNVVKLTKDTNSNSHGILQDGGSVLDWDVADKSGQVLMTHQYVADDRIGSHLGSSDEGLGVDLVDTLSVKRTRYEAPDRDAVQYITDGHGLVRIKGTQGSNATGYSSNKLKYYYRALGSRDWKGLSTVSLVDQADSGFYPVSVDSTRNVVYGFENHGNTSALFSIKLDGTNQHELVLGRSDVDIDQLVTIGRNSRVVGASYATERRSTEYFDPELKKLSAALSKALPDHPNVDIVDASQDESKLLLLAWSDTNPGLFYLFDKKTRHLDEVMPVREQLEKMPLAPVKAITYAAADGTSIPAYLTLPVGSSGKGLPAIVMPHGGPGARDEWGFDWLAQYFAARGFAVLQPNFRGSAGYGNAWYQNNGFKSWRVAVGDVNDAGRWLVSSGIAKHEQLGVLGWSYGGYAALQSAVLDPDLFKAIVAIAPVTDLEHLRQEATQYVNFPQVDAFIGKGAHVKEGSPAQNADRFKAPVLMFHGTMDQNVDVGSSRLMEGKLKGAGKQVTYVEFKGLDHQLRSPAARAQLLSEADAFLRKAFGLPSD